MNIILLIISVVLFFAFIALLIYAIKDRSLSSGIGSFVSLVLSVCIVLGCSIYTQDAGEVVVLRNYGGSLAGTSSEAGLHVKMPWQDAIKYDVRNNVVSFVGDGAEDYVGGSANGPQVSVNDSGGAVANLDIQVNYSLNSDYAQSLYENYGSQENFVKNVVAVDVRSIPREIAGQFDTITLLTNRGEYTAAVQEALANKWKDLGLNVEQVSIQEVRYSDAIVNKYAEAQAAEIAKAQALNEQETAKVQAETKVIEAQGQADANAILTQSLTPEVLQQKYIDALNNIGANGNLVVVPENSQPIVNTK